METRRTHQAESLQGVQTLLKHVVAYGQKRPALRSHALFAGTIVAVDGGWQVLFEEQV